MIKFEMIVPKKVFKIFRDGDEIAELELSSPSSISNRFNYIIELIEDMEKLIGDEFSEWFVDFFINLYEHTCSYCKKYNDDSKCLITTNEDQKINKKNKKLNLESQSDCILLSENELFRKKLVFDNVDKIKYFIDKYLDIKQLNLSNFINRSKIKKNSIVFEIYEIEKILRLSSYLKVYSLISNSDNLKLDNRIHKEIFNMFLESIDKTIIEKIFEVIRTKAFKYKQTDSFMWEYINMIQSKEIDTYIVEIFNFLMANTLVLCQLDRNPITYFVTVVDSAIIWILRSVYKASVIYSDEITSDEIQTVKTNNLKAYSYNDTFGRIKIISYDYVYKKLEEISEKNNIDYNGLINNFHDRMKLIKQESPLISFLVFPIISKLLNIPYNYLRSLNYEQSTVLSSYLKTLLLRSFDKNHSYLFRLLDYYPDPNSHVPISTSYIIKQVGEYVNLYNEIKNFMNFNTCSFQKDIYGNLMGRLRRVKFRNLFTNETLLNIEQSKLEKDIIYFYTYYFAGLYDKSFFIQMKNDLIKLF